MGYEVTSKSYNKKICVWDISAEIFIAKLASRLIVIRNITKSEANKIIRDLNFKYLRKKNTDKIQNYVATNLQRSVINEDGY